MDDTISKERRSWNMSRIKNRDTKPELIVRSMLSQMGYRFHLHRKDLPGKPDIVLPKGVNPGTLFSANLLTRVESRRQTWESLSGAPVGIEDPESNRRV